MQLSSRIIGAFSLLLVFLEKYMSFERCFYFDFDMNYFDFSLSTESLFVFIIAFIAGILGVVWSVIQNKIWNIFESKIINVKKIAKKEKDTYYAHEIYIIIK
jgi:hypothetical protein